MNTALALARWRAHSASYRAYGWAGRLTLRKYMAAGRHKINPWLSRYDGCIEEVDHAQA